jgi:hypothetical protein
MLIKVFGVVDKRNGHFVDAWIADSYEEAQRDNPDSKIIEFEQFEGINFILNQLWKVNVKV